MKKVLLGMGTLLLVAAALFLGLSGCVIIAATDGYVINAKTGEGLAGATVVLQSLDAAATKFEALSDSLGHYVFQNYKLGRYELTASLTGKIFTKQVVEVTGLAQTLPNIGGFDTTQDLTIVVFWDRDFADVDAYMTAPAANLGPAVVSSSDFYSTSGGAGTGFFPASSGRNEVSFVTPDLGPGDITLDVDNQGQTDQQPGGPETITVAWIPFTANYQAINIYSAAAADPSKLPVGDYNWVGVLEYYLDAWASTNTSATAAAPAEALAMLASVDGVTKTANPVVYVFANGAQVARYTLPQFTDIKTASILRVNMFVDTANAEWYQILPDTRAYQDSGSIKANDDNGIIVVGGKVRR